MDQSVHIAQRDAVRKTEDEASLRTDGRDHGRKGCGHNGELPDHEDSDRQGQNATLQLEKGHDA